jgi:hypothetical protein
MRWDDSIATARDLSARFPRNYLFKLQLADAMALKIAAARKSKAAVNPSAVNPAAVNPADERELFAIFDSLLRDKTFAAQTQLIQFRRTETLRLLR